MNTELRRKVHEDYTSFFKELLYTNRFFCEGEFTEKIKELSYRVTSEILEGTFLYRARIMPNLKLGQTVSRDGLEYLIKEGKVDKNSSRDEFERCLKDLDIWGYNEKNSGMPPLEKTVDGRTNPKFIPYLYVAQDKYTALVESKPYMGEKVSIATYKVVQTLKIFDISLRSCGEDADYFDVLNNFLSMKFSQPLRDGTKEYIVTQYISEYIKKLGFDGICFSSSLCSEGKNITLYTNKKVNFQKSEVYKVKDIIIKTEPKAPHYAEKIDR